MPPILKYLLLFLVSLVILLVATKPSEEDYLNQIVRDYSQIHPGIELSEEDLVSMGSTQYHSQLIYSSYTYKFGGIAVNYWGILGYIINNGYEKEDDKEKKSSKTGVLG